MGRIDLNYVLLTHFDFNEGPPFFFNHLLRAGPTKPDL